MNLTYLLGLSLIFVAGIMAGHFGALALVPTLIAMFGGMAIASSRHQEGKRRARERFRREWGLDE